MHRHEHEKRSAMKQDAERIIGEIGIDLINKVSTCEWTDTRGLLRPSIKWMQENHDCTRNTAVQYLYQAIRRARD